MSPVLVRKGDSPLAQQTALGGDSPRLQVLAVHASATHSLTKQSAAAIQLVHGVGVAGDAHAGATVKHRSRVKRDPTQPNFRQVHLIHAELHDELLKKGFDIAPGQLGENITTRGIDLLCAPGRDEASLRFGPLTNVAARFEAVIEITGLRNPCSQLDSIAPGLMAAVLDRDAAGNLLRKAGVMAIVIASGEVRPGDAIEIELPAEHRPLSPV